MRKESTFFRVFLLLPILAMSLFSCSSDAKMYDPAVEIISFSVDSPLVVDKAMLDEEKKNHFVFTLDPATTAEDLKALKTVIRVTPDCSVTPASGSEVDYSGTEPVEFVVKHNLTGQQQTFTAKAVRNKYEGAEITKVSLEYDKLIEGPELPEYGTDIEFIVSAEATADEMSQLKPVFEISSGAKISPESGTPQDFNQGTVEYTVTSESGKETVYTLICIRKHYTGASVSSVSIADPNNIVIEQAKLNAAANQAIFYVGTYTSDEEIAKLIPTIEVSPGATISPDLSVAPGFAEDKPITFTITSEDGEFTEQLVVTAKKYKYTHSFESWKTEGGGKAERLEPGNSEDPDDLSNQWSTSNYGVASLIGLNRADKFAVLPTEFGYKNQGVELNTIKTKGGSFIFNKIPHVTSGSLFLGTFKTDYSNTLRSTKFGVPFEYKPERVTLYYKYTPGPLFLRSTTARPDVYVEEEGTLDECVITVVLYEIESDDDDYLHGENLATADNIVAIAVLEDGTAKDEFTKLNLDLNYIKEYDPEKKYRFSVVCSSSKWGDTFSGAWDSSLIVDEINVYYKK